jgi:glyoxylase-like metal-dependent hydrolase (beta-lactamase superfamily II)
MKIEKLSERHIIFKYDLIEWDLNIHLIVGKKYNYLIDTGLGSASVEPIMEFLKGNPNPIIVINTHHDWDHVWGNGSFRDHTIISHWRCRDMMMEEWGEMLDRNKCYIEGEASLCLPNLVFDDTLYFPDDKIRVFFTPGHTPDSISILDEVEKVINVGDNIGDTVEEVVPGIETTKEVYLNTLMRYMALDVDFCVSGHNTVLGREVFGMIQKALG